MVWAALMRSSSTIASSSADRCSLVATMPRAQGTMRFSSMIASGIIVYLCCGVHSEKLDLGALEQRGFVRMALVSIFKMVGEHTNVTITHSFAVAGEGRNSEMELPSRCAGMLVKT